MIDGYLKQTCLLRRTTARAADGSRTYEQSTIPCRIDYGNRMIRNAQGEEVVSTARVWTTEEVRAGDTLVFGGRDWPVVQAQEKRGMELFSHYEVWL